MASARPISGNGVRFRRVGELRGATHGRARQRAHSDALGDALTAAVASLPLLQREAFLLRAEGGLGLEDIALATGTNRETAKSRLRYAIRRLRETLEPWA